MAGSTPCPDTFRLNGGTVFGTGASRGIGRALVGGLAEAGTDVAILCEETRNRAARFDEVRALGRDHTYVNQVDIGTSEDFARMAVETEERFGRIDSLVTNAGIAHNAAAEDMKLAEWERMIRINLTCMFLCCQAVGRLMIRQRARVIVNVGFLSAQQNGNFLQKHAHYNVARAGVHLLTKCLAVAWAPHHIWVKVLLPGYIHTKLLDPIIARRAPRSARTSPYCRIGSGSRRSLVAAITYVALEASTFMTGEEMVVDDGFTLR